MTHIFALPPPICIFELPEIISNVLLYLGASDIISCSSVSRTFYTAFAPLIWRDIGFTNTVEPLRRQNSFSRIFNITRLSPLNSSYDQESSDRQLLSVLQKHTSIIQTIRILSHESSLPLELGEQCTNLTSIIISRISSKSGKDPTGKETANFKHSVEQYRRCKKMFLQNRSCLRSVTLCNWTYDKLSKAEIGEPIWNPLIKCVDAFNLRSLSLKDCCIRGRYLRSLWIICERLEKLEFIEVQIDLSQPPVIRRKDGGHKSEGSNHNAAVIPWPPRFPRLKDLCIRRLSKNSVHRELNLIVAQCPVLQSLLWEWTLPVPGSLISREFCDLFVSGTWPDLDSIEIAGWSGFTHRDLELMLGAAKKPFRNFDILSHTRPQSLFNVFRGHFSALRSINLCRFEGPTNTFTIEVLRLCPMLETLIAKSVSALDIIGSEPWVCDRLQVLIVIINMGFGDGINNRRLNQEEIQQCRAVYSQLAKLKQLREFDMYSSRYDARSTDRNFGMTFYPLPLRLKAGLDLLAGLTGIEKIGFWTGRQMVRMKELRWMADHWKFLCSICSGSRIQRGRHNELRDNYLTRGKLVEWLATQRIKILAYEEQYYEKDSPEDVDYVDAFSDDDCEVEVDRCL